MPPFGNRHGQRGWQSPQVVILSDFEVWDHLPKLRASGLGLAQYALTAGVGRQALAASIKLVSPTDYDDLVAAGVIGLQADRGKTGTKLETSARQMLERRGYVVMRAPGSHGVIDLLAVRKNTTGLMIQAKKDGNARPWRVERTRGARREGRLLAVSRASAGGRDEGRTVVPLDGAASEGLAPLGVPLASANAVR